MPSIVSEGPEIWNDKQIFDSRSPRRPNIALCNPIDHEMSRAGRGGAGGRGVHVPGVRGDAIPLFAVPGRGVLLFAHVPLVSPQR